MCCRFFFDLPEEDNEEELLALLNRASLQETRLHPGFTLKQGEYGPGESAPVIALSRQRKPAAYLMRWGFRAPAPKKAQPAFEQLRMELVPPPQERTAGRLVINARWESAFARPMFRDAMLHRRCVIPARAYFEWDHRRVPLVKCRFQPVGEPLFLLAGLYRWQEGGALEFTVLTQEASPDVSPYHDRMPVMLRPTLLRDWLDTGCPPEEIIRQSLTHVACQEANRKV